MLDYKALNQELTIQDLPGLPEDIKLFLQEYKEHPLYLRTLNHLHYTHGEVGIYPPTNHVKSTLLGYHFNDLKEIVSSASISWLLKAWKLNQKCKTIKDPCIAYNFRLYTYPDDQAFVEATEWWALLEEHPMFNDKKYIGVSKHCLS